MTETLLRCSFCGKDQNHVRKLIAGPTHYSNICDECVKLCTEILRDSEIETIVRRVFEEHRAEIRERILTAPFPPGTFARLWKRAL